MCAAATASFTSWKATTAHIHKESFRLVQHLSPGVSTALRTFIENVPGDIFTAVCFSQLYGMAAKSTWECSTGFNGRQPRIGRRFKGYKEQERAKNGSQFEKTCNAEAGSFYSKSDLAAVLVPPNVEIKNLASSSASVTTRMAALPQASRRCLRFHECKSTELFSARDKMSYPGPVLDCNV